MQQPDLLNGRCAWAGNDPLYQHYHDIEWGHLVTNDSILFEYLVLESAQAGLSWLTILKKRKHYRHAFYQFDVCKVAAMTEQDVTRLMTNSGIIRHRGKIEAAINNAALFLQIQQEYGSFYLYCRSFFSGNFPIIHTISRLKDMPIQSRESLAMSQDMKKRGFRFFGSITCYSFLQATGFINDHLLDCRYRNVSS